MVELIENDQFNAAVLKEVDRAVGQRLDRAGTPRRIPQRKKNVGSNAFRLRVGLECDFQYALTRGGLGFFNRE